MLPTVLVDSEDEDDDLVDHDRDTIRVHASNTGSAPGIVNQSTGSTERLRAQIQQAEIDLTSDIMATRVIGNQTLTTSSLKRRHSERSSQQPHEDLTPKLKRIRSSGVTTLSSGLLSQPFQQVQMFSSHDDHRQATFAVPASLSGDICSQEPLMLFGQSGDTIPFNTAEQQAARDVFRIRNAVIETILEPDPVMQPPSSSVLLSASQLDQTSANFNRDTNDNSTGSDLQDFATVSLSSPLERHGDQTSQTRDQIAASQKSNSSTIVVKGTSLSKKVAPPPETQAEPISSQTAIGLPKEQYVPRPSRRRAKPLDEIPDINEVDPNKIGRTARSKKAAKNKKLTKSAQSEDLVLGDGHTDKENVFQSPKSAEAVDTISLQDAEATTVPTVGTSDDDELAISHQVCRQPSVLSKKAQQPGGRRQKKGQHTVSRDVEETIISQEPSPTTMTLKEGKTEVKANIRGRKSVNVTPDEDDDDDELALNAKDFPSTGKITSIIDKSIEEASSPVQHVDTEPQSERAKSSAAQEKPSNHATNVVSDESDANQVKAEDNRSPSPRKKAAVTKLIKPDIELLAATPSLDIKTVRTANISTAPAAAPMRVGLSKRNRIPSLLKIMRPPKKT